MSMRNYLHYEIALLLAKYGKNAVLHALASNLQLTQDDLDTILDEIPSGRLAARSKKSKRDADTVDQLIGSHPDKEAVLRVLYTRFQNRTFLPELRDVRRFLEQYSKHSGVKKSRAASAYRVFEVLAQLDARELGELCEAAPNGAYSSLGLISDEILRPR